MNAIQPSHFAQWLEHARARAPEGPLPVVLDVREPWEFQTASVTPNDFELTKMPMRSVPARYMELDRSRPIACLCHHGARSAQVVRFLMEQGFTEVVNIHGGIHAWSQEKDPSVPQY
ncbi:rhodanese-like domain-containing protein [Hydrogenophaga sp.]|uniref:rhodanese-like domain-containing protein n=1 Tax=Hydrogenophaga sp. TaxID=1904254 RepID=UPI00272705B7|nr:rhodanese-like domain-containing protein [Hydrogenophaga sp.]MDO8903906.1 rhodanese-like domain-containing protein [Hydrogenophaga sp.]